MPAAPLIHLENVSVVRDGRPILDDVSLSVANGEHLVIAGGNGAGKTTLIKVMTRELYPHAGLGRVEIGGQERPDQKWVRKHLCAVIADQAQQLINDPTVIDLVVSGFYGTFGILFGYEVSNFHYEAARRALKVVDLLSLADRPVSSLSTGEGRRAWIARAMVDWPDALILDEPTANLDNRAVKKLNSILAEIAETGVSVILVTHRIDEVPDFIQRAVLMREGKIVCDGLRRQVLSEKSLDELLAAQPNAAAQAYEGEELTGPSALNWQNPETPAEYLEAMGKLPVYDVAIRSPLERAPFLSNALGNNVWLKREDRQPVFSFKLRGAYAYMSQIPPDLLAKGVIAASAGNHAQGVALAAKTLGCKATIVVPRTTPSVKTDAIIALGADLILHGDTYDEAYAHAVEIGQDRGLTFVHPYDQPIVIAGQGTVGLEVIEQMGDAPIHAVFVAVGGGGLISGVALAVKQLCPTAKVIGVEPEDSDAMHQSLLAGKRVTLDKVGLLADGVAVKTVGKTTFRVVQEWVDEIILVSNDEICGAVKEVFEDRRAVLEPSGALAYAGLKKYVERQHVVNQNLIAIACGANVSFDRLRYIAERAAVGEQREAILAVTIPEHPGSFRAFCAAIGNRNVTEFNYRMGNPDRAAVFVGVAVKDENERRELVEGLDGAGYPTVDLTLDELATTHLRHMVGGRSPEAAHERLFHVDFPERVGALGGFLQKLGDAFNISLFHYRNHGSDTGRVLVGFQVPEGQAAEFDRFLLSLDYTAVEVTLNPGLSLFLK